MNPALSACTGSASTVTTERNMSSDGTVNTMDEMVTWIAYNELRHSAFERIKALTAERNRYKTALEEIAVQDWLGKDHYRDPGAQEIAVKALIAGDPTA